jgi:hypothetical protein
MAGFFPILFESTPGVVYCPSDCSPRKENHGMPSVRIEQSARFEILREV